MDPLRPYRTFQDPLGPWETLVNLLDHSRPGPFNPLAPSRTLQNPGPSKSLHYPLGPYWTLLDPPDPPRPSQPLSDPLGNSRALFDPPDIPGPFQTPLEPLGPFRTLQNPGRFRSLHYPLGLSESLWDPLKPSLTLPDPPDLRIPSLTLLDPHRLSWTFLDPSRTSRTIQDSCRSLGPS